ncbi:Uncharacterised protein at_DN0253 [Pycnogonum litorale]
MNSDNQCVDDQSGAATLNSQQLPSQALSQPTIESQQVGSNYSGVLSKPCPSPHQQVLCNNILEKATEHIRESFQYSPEQPDAEYSSLSWQSSHAASCGDAQYHDPTSIPSDSIRSYVEIGNKDERSPMESPVKKRIEENNNIVQDDAASPNQQQIISRDDHRRTYEESPEGSKPQYVHRVMSSNSFQQTSIPSIDNFKKTIPGGNGDGVNFQIAGVGQNNNGKSEAESNVRLLTSPGGKETHQLDGQDTIIGQSNEEMPVATHSNTVTSSVHSMTQPHITVTVSRESMCQPVENHAGGVSLGDGHKRSSESPENTENQNYSADQMTAVIVTNAAATHVHSIATESISPSMHEMHQATPVTESIQHMHYAPVVNPHHSSLHHHHQHQPLLESQVNVTQSNDVPSVGESVSERQYSTELIPTDLSNMQESKQYVAGEIHDMKSDPSHYVAGEIHDMKSDPSHYVAGEIHDMKSDPSHYAADMISTSLAGIEDNKQYSSVNVHMIKTEPASTLSESITDDLSLNVSVKQEVFDNTQEGEDNKEQLKSDQAFISMVSLPSMSTLPPFSTATRNLTFATHVDANPHQLQVLQQSEVTSANESRTQIPFVFSSNVAPTAQPTVLPSLFRMASTQSNQATLTTLTPAALPSSSPEVAGMTGTDALVAPILSVPSASFATLAPPAHSDQPYLLIPVSGNQQLFALAPTISSAATVQASAPNSVMTHSSEMQTSTIASNWQANIGSISSESDIQTSKLDSGSSGAKPQNKTHMCNLCGKHFSSRAVHNLHMRSHSGEKPYPCSICGRHFSQKTSLTRHMRSHTGERPYPCDMCGKRFSDKERVKIHMRSHTGEKPFPCNVCGKHFSQKSTVKRHMSVHTGERPFKCETCGKGFANRGNLNSHIRTHIHTSSH